jgi:hypothetical protein
VRQQWHCKLTAHLPRKQPLLSCYNTGYVSHGLCLQCFCTTSADKFDIGIHQTQSASSQVCNHLFATHAAACRTAATAKKATAISKKAVTGIKEAAHDLSVQSLTAKHKLPGQQPEPSPSSSRGPGSHLLASPLTDLLLVRRSTGEVGLLSSTAPAMLLHTARHLHNSSC